MDTVDISRFTMFLFLQVCAHRCATSRDIPGDSWPSLPNLRPCLQELQTKIASEATLLAYIMSHIKEALYLLASCADPSLIDQIVQPADAGSPPSLSRSVSGDTASSPQMHRSPRSLPFKASSSNSSSSAAGTTLAFPQKIQIKASMRAEFFDALSVFIGGGRTQQLEEKHLSVLTGLWDKEPEGSVLVTTLTEWLSQHIKPNPLRYPPITFTGQPSQFNRNHSSSSSSDTTQSDLNSSLEQDSLSDIVPPSGSSLLASSRYSSSSSSSSSSDSKNTPAITFPVIPPFPDSPLILSCTKVTSLHIPRELCTTRVIASSKAHIYITAAVRDCSIVSCEACTIFIGAVEKVLSLTHCSKLTVIAAAGRVKLSNCSDITLHLLTPSPLLITPTCKRIVLAPYNACYPSIHSNMAAAHLDMRLCGCWDKAFISDSNTLPSAPSSPTSTFSHTSSSSTAFFSLTSTSPSSPLSTLSSALSPSSFSPPFSSSLSGYSLADPSTSSSFSLMHPTQFSSFAIPFACPGAAAQYSDFPDFPQCLPPIYQEEMERRREVKRLLQREIAGDKGKDRDKKTGKEKGEKEKREGKEGERNGSEDEDEDNEREESGEGGADGKGKAKNSGDAKDGEKEMKKEGLDAESAQKVEAIIQRKFREWLASTNQLRQIHDLLHMQMGNIPSSALSSSGPVLSSSMYLGGDGTSAAPSATSSAPASSSSSSSSSPSTQSLTSAFSQLSTTPSSHSPHPKVNSSLPQSSSTSAHSSQHSSSSSLSSKTTASNISSRINTSDIASSSSSVAPREVVGNEILSPPIMRMPHTSRASASSALSSSSSQSSPLPSSTQQSSNSRIVSGIRSATLSSQPK
eukprot:MONOS_1390.1-p1 / transcript=MONOS_1390.1 / gene=MONOS_1390 / organism=Monocercomonoides_exilis_PA203 / gene_product=unspecified product / transcript_product=unspecified product / location=Mono_scaffold00024:81034-84335(-) / protein_length=853 / sequence_SO=supercontig / SO=protein_coding / is_pseudo=false